MFGAGEWWWVMLLAGAGLLLGPAEATGQGSGGGARAMGAGEQAALVEMAARAGVIFTGEVMGIARVDAKGYVEARFRVEEAVRGVARNGASDYVLREWAGLWTGAERYRVGQRYLMLLTAPVLTTASGVNGLSAPVDGMDGAIPLVAGGAEPLLGKGGVVPGDVGVNAPERLVDLRWLGATVLRTAAHGRGDTHSESTLITKDPETKEGEADSRLEAVKMVGAAWRSAALTMGPVRVWEPEKAWVGAVVPLASVDAGGGVGLNEVLALLHGGGGGAHEAR